MPKIKYPQRIDTNTGWIFIGWFQLFSSMIKYRTKWLEDGAEGDPMFGNYEMKCEIFNDVEKANNFYLELSSQT